MSYPITVYEDTGDNHAIADGNPRAYKAEIRGLEIKREIIGHLNGDISKDPYFRPISELKVR